MIFPPDRAMLSLAALDQASVGRYTTDGRTLVRVYLTDDTVNLWDVLPGEMDDLEAEGWVELLPPGPDDPEHLATIAVTSKGRYALTRWLQKNRRQIRQLIETHYPKEKPE